MSKIEKILNDIENLSNEEKQQLFKKFKEKYFNKEAVLAVGENFYFWLNEQDEEYEPEE